MRDTFIRGAHVVLDAVSMPAVAEAWDAPSVLAQQTIGALAGHLARGGVWVVDDYLDAAQPDGPPTFSSADEYFAVIANGLTAADHESIRSRGVGVAADGPAAVVDHLSSRLSRLEHRLPLEHGDRLLPVYGGTMQLDGYLGTRVVEQVVHLDDLARSLTSLGITARWTVADEHLKVAVDIGLGIGIRRRGAKNMVRALFRDQVEAGVLPVM